MSIFRVVYTTKDEGFVLRHDLYVDGKIVLTYCDYGTAMDYIRDHMKPGDGHQYEDIENNFVTEVIGYEFMMNTFEMEDKLRRGEL